MNGAAANPRPRGRFIVCSLLAIPVVAACATMPRCERPGGDTDLDPIITAEEIASTNAATAYDVIARARPDLLEPFVPPAGGTWGVTRGIGYDLAVSMDGEQPVARPRLRSVPAAEVAQIEWLDRCEALEEFSSAYPKGVVRISTIGLRP